MRHPGDQGKFRQEAEHAAHERPGDLRSRPSHRCSPPRAKALKRSGLTVEDLTCIIPHQANARIIEALAERLDLPLSKFHVNLDRYGNTSAAAVAIALDEANRTGRFKEGDYILMVVFGGGLTHASSVVQW